MNKILFMILFVITFGCNQNDIIKDQTQNDSLDTGLIAYYPFNGNANDASGYERNGIVKNAHSYTKGVSQQAIKVIGEDHTFSTSGGYILLPMIDTTNLKELSISFWVKEDTLFKASAGEGYIILGANTSNGWCGIGHFYGRIQFTVGAFGVLPKINPPDNEILPVSINFNESTDTKKWIFYSLVYSNGYFKAYKNAILVAGLRQQLYINGDSIFIASHTWSGQYKGQSTRFTGAFDEVRIYDRALNGQEIWALYLKGKANL